MRIRGHIAVSALLGAGLYMIFKSVPMAIGAFLGGVLIDVDHVIEGYINYGKKFNLFDTIKVSENCDFAKIHLFLHSYELLLAYTIIICYLGLGGFWIGLAFGLILHMIIDNTFNSYYSNGLFLLKRLKVGFKIDKIIDVKKQLQKNKRKNN